MPTKKIVALTLAGAAFLTHAQTPRVALLLSEKGRHHDEFDSALDTLGWNADRYRCTADDMRKLAGSLGDYDMLVAAPLFWPQPPDAKDAEAFRAFIENGGLLAVTDGSYPQGRAWLAGIDPRFGGLETGKCNSSQWAVNGVTADAEPAHPLRFFPSRIREPNSWPHFLEPPKDTTWRLVARCSEGFPVTFAQTVGKGLVTLSALRQPAPKQLGNFYACLQLLRAGIALKTFELPEPAIGDGTLRLAFEGNGPVEACGFAYELVPENGKSQRFEKDADGAVFELPYRIALRGPVTARLLLKRGGQEIPLFERRAALPPLLTVTPPAYRGILSTARRLPAVHFGVALAPDQENLEGATLAFTVLDPCGNPVAATNTTLATNSVQPAYRQPVALPPSLTEGGYTLKAALIDAKKKKLAEAETAFTILAPRPAQTVVDEDGTFLVNGKPFFPLGLYHVPPADYADVARLGVNTVQFWAWHTALDKLGVSRGLAAAAAHGLKAVYEFNHKGKGIYQDAANNHAGNPALLMWYGLDEPSEGSYAAAAELRDTLHAADAHHPVYTVSCRKDVYAEHAAFADVFAIDPYGKPANAAECLPLAVAAVAPQGKPLVCVPGAFGKEETPEEMRATAYLALAHDARGIIWYPWAQAGGGPLGVGCKNSPAQQEAISNICAEVNALLPALTAPVRQSFASEDGRLRCLYMQGRPRCVLMVNGTPEKLETEARLPALTPGLEKTNAKTKDFFKKREDVIEIKEGRFRVALEPYETRVYCW
jgi:hypothetical protein